MNALLRHAGLSATAIRSMQHNFAKRTEQAIAKGLKLRKRTEVHLAALEGRREYLVTRYEPEMKEMVSQINRLTASLEEVAGKVTEILTKGAR